MSGMRCPVHDNELSLGTCDACEAERDQREVAELRTRLAAAEETIAQLQSDGYKRAACEVILGLEAKVANLEQALEFYQQVAADLRAARKSGGPCDPPGLGGSTD